MCTAVYIFFIIIWIINYHNKGRVKIDRYKNDGQTYLLQTKFDVLLSIFTALTRLLLLYIIIL